MAIKIGNHRDRVDIERNTPTNNSAGEQVESWAAIYSGLPAEIKPLRGRRFYEAQQLNSELTVEITLRYVPGVLGRDRIKDVTTGTYYQMVAPPINVDNRGFELNLMCKVLT